VKLTIKRTCLGDRLCFPEVIPDRLIAVQAGGGHRLDASAMSMLDDLFHWAAERGSPLPTTG
jgi:hypothetical protein